MSADIFSFPRFKKEANGQVSFTKVAAVAKAVTVDEESRKLSAIITTRSVDRDGDIVETDGINLLNYSKNPVVLWAHDYSMPPIAKVENVMTGHDQMLADIQFADTDFAKEIFSLYKGGFLNAFSIGFTADPKKASPIYDDDSNITGWRIGGSELLELSSVPVPANPEALARSLEGFSKKVKQFFVKEEKPKPALLQHDTEAGGVWERTEADGEEWELTGKTLAEGAFKKSVEERGKNAKIPVEILFGDKSSTRISFETIQEQDDEITEAKIASVSITIAKDAEAPSESDDDQDEGGREGEGAVETLTPQGAKHMVDMLELEMSVINLNNRL